MFQLHQLINYDPFHMLRLLIILNPNLIFLNIKVFNMNKLKKNNKKFNKYYNNYFDNNFFMLPNEQLNNN